MASSQPRGERIERPAPRIEAAAESSARAEEIVRALTRATLLLEAADASVPDLLRLVPELICELGFDRGLISRVEDDVWIPELLHVAGNPEWSAELTEIGKASPQALIPGRFETDLVNSQRGVLALNVYAEPWRVHPGLAPSTRGRSYVAAPIISGGRVVGILHAERFDQGREVDEADRGMLEVFAQAVQLAFSRAALATELRSVYQRLTLATRSVDRAVADVHGVPELRLETEPAGGSPGGLGVRSAALSARGTGALPAGLSARELEVLALIAGGKTNATIARRLGIAESTVKQHVKNILRKLDVGTRAEAVARWFNVDNIGTI